MDVGAFLLVPVGLWLAVEWFYYVLERNFLW